MATGATQEVTGTGQEIRSEGMTLIVADCHWSADTAGEFGEEAIIAGDIAATSFQATQDGIGFHTRWHKGAEADAIYAERYEMGERAWHGWIDSGSRCIVQSG